ncbi:hypothetical protein Tco_0414990 [Tanacetum coccineum]
MGKVEVSLGSSSFPANSGGEKEIKALIFHKIYTEEISDRYVAPCFVNGLEAYDGEINLGMEENTFSNEFVVKLCLEHKVKRGHKVVKKELIVALRGYFYFVNSGEEEKIVDDWDLLLDDLDFGDIPNIKGVEVPSFVCKIGKNSRNKRKQLEKYQLIYFDIGPSLSTRKLLTREEAEREALAINICRRYSLLEEERPVIETMAYNDKYKKILDGICLYKMKLDREMKKEGEEAITRIKGEALIEKEDPRAFVGVTTIIPKFLILDMSIERDTPILVGRGFLYTSKTSLDTAESDSDDEEEYAIQRNKFGAPIYGSKSA